MKGRITRVGLVLIAISIGFNVATLTAALAGTDTVTYYLKGTALPVAGMSTTPVSGPLSTFKALGDDDDPGRTLDDTDEGISEDNKDKYQQWEVPASGLQIDGPSTFIIWIASDEFDDEETVSAQIFLLDCPGSPCTQLATALKTDFLPGNNFAKITMTFPSVDHTFGPGRTLAVRIVYPEDFKGDAPKIHLAYAATAYPSSLTVTVPGSTATTTTTVPSSTTTKPPTGSTTSTTTTTLPWGTTTTSSTTLPWGTTTTSSTTLPWGTTTTSTTFPGETTTTLANNETTTTLVSGGQGLVTTTTLPASPDARPVSSATEKSSLVIAASSAGVAADVFNTERRLSPQEGLEVSFLSAAEAIRSQFLASTGLGLLGGLLVVVGMRRKLEEDEEQSEMVGGIGQ